MAKKSASEMMGKLAAVCARELNQAPEKISLTLKAEKESSRQVDMTVEVPTGMVGLGSTGVNANSSAGGALYSTSFNETVLREMPVREIRADCRLEQASLK